MSKVKISIVREQTSADDRPIEAYGVRGMKSLRWRKQFKNSAALDAWVEQNDAEVWGIRDLDPEESGMYSRASPTLSDE